MPRVQNLKTDSLTDPAGRLPVSSTLVLRDESRLRQAELFCQVVDPIFRTTHDMQAGEEALHTQLTTYFMGPAIFFVAEVGGRTYRFNRDPAKIARTGIDLVLVQMALEGGDIRSVDDESITTRPGDVCIVDLSRPLTAQTQTCRNLTLALPRHLLFGRENRMDGLHGFVLNHTTSAGHLIGNHLRTLFQDMPQITRGEAPAIVQATADLIANLVAPRLESGREPSAAVRGAVIVRMKQYIEQHLAAAELGPDHLCKSFGDSRASLYRLFEPIGGVTDYIRTRRLRRAFDMLRENRDLPVGEIAYACGFTQVSAFSRAFRHKFGIRPSEVRGSDGNLAEGYFPPHAAVTAVHDWLRIVSAL